jgi:NAD(P)-dependent dehydrogenase (short-subunit alcohol dehydrogenase family)
MTGMGSALVVGASRGIGLAITRALLDIPSLDQVCATYRDPDSAAGLLNIQDPRLHRFAVELTRESSLQALASGVRALGKPPALVIHCAGILHEPGVQPEKALRQCEPEALQRLFAVNSIGPLMTAKAIVPLMPKRDSSHFAVLSAMVGSITDNRLGGWYGYRASKAALNQLLKTLAIECRRSHPELCVTAIHPGTTDTALSRPFQGNVKPSRLYRPDQSAARIIEVVLAGKPEDSGRFVNWDGSTLPY